MKKEMNSEKLIVGTDKQWLEMKSEELRVKSTERKRSEGITLIALIITIIILIILAMVSVRIITDSNIKKHAENATEIYSVEQEKELIGVAYSDYKMETLNNKEYTMQNALDNLQADAIAEGNGTTGWTITFNASGNVYTLRPDGTVISISNEMANSEWWMLTDEEVESIRQSTYAQEDDDGNISATVAVGGTDMTNDETASVITIIVKDNQIALIVLGNLEKGIIVSYATAAYLEGNDVSNDDIKETYKWYTDSGSIDQIAPYTGPSPVSMDDFNLYVPTGCEGVINRIIESFNLVGGVNIEKIQQDVIENRDKYLQRASNLGQDIENNKDIGIGKQGQILNLDDWKYEKVEDGFAITGFGRLFIGNGNVVVPQYIIFADDAELMNVTELSGDLSFGSGRPHITEIPDTVKRIGSRALMDQFGNGEVFIPNSVEEIGENALGFSGSVHVNSETLIVTVDNVEGAIEGAPWGATDVIWLRK